MKRKIMEIMGIAHEVMNKKNTNKITAEMREILKAEGYEIGVYKKPFMLRDIDEGIERDNLEVESCFIRAKDFLDLSEDIPLDNIKQHCLFIANRYKRMIKDAGIVTIPKNASCQIDIPSLGEEIAYGDTSFIPAHRFVTGHIGCLKGSVLKPEHFDKNYKI